MQPTRPIWVFRAANAATGLFCGAGVIIRTRALDQRLDTSSPRTIFTRNGAAERPESHHDPYPPTYDFAGTLQGFALTRQTDEGRYTASVSIRSGRGAASHDRVFRFMPTFATREDALDYALAQGPHCLPA